jgi:hypothetical protein
VILEHSVSIGSGSVTGVAQLADRFYVSMYMCSDIRVFNVADAKEQSSIAAPELNGPWDMAACPLYGRLYVTDFYTAGIWYFQLQERRTTALQSCWPLSCSSSSEEAAVADEQTSLATGDAGSACSDQGWLVKGVANPRGISVTPDGLVLVVSWDREMTDQSSIHVYDPRSGNHLSRILLPQHIDMPHHAVELPLDGNLLAAAGGGDHGVPVAPGRRFFAVCHGRHDTLHRVSVVLTSTSPSTSAAGDDVVGEVVRWFGDAKLQKWKTAHDDKNDDEHDNDDSSSSSDLPQAYVVTADEDYDDADSLRSTIGSASGALAGLMTAENFFASRLVTSSANSGGCPDEEYTEERREAEHYQRLDTPYAVAVDTDGHVLVADFGGERILVLDSEMRLVRTLVTGLSEIRQVWVDQSSGRIFVGQDTGLVAVYRVRDT